MEHIVGRQHYDKMPTVGEDEKIDREFNFVADKIPYMPPSFLWSTACGGVCTHHEYYSEKDSPKEATRHKNRKVDNWKGEGWNGEELEENDWFNFKGIPHNVFGLASQIEYMRKGGCRYDIDLNEWGSKSLEVVHTPKIQDLFKQTGRRHILIHHGADNCEWPDILVSYWDVEEFRALGYKMNRKTHASRQGSKCGINANAPVDHFDRAKWKAERHGEGYNGYYIPEFVLSFSLPCGYADEPNGDMPLFNTDSFAVTSNKGLQDLLTACDPDFFNATACLNTRTEFQKIGKGKKDWAVTCPCVDINTSSIHMAINEALWVLGYSIRREVKQSCSPQAFHKIRKAQDLPDLFGADNKKKVYGSHLLVLPKVSYSGGDEKRGSKDSFIEIRPHDRDGHWVQHRTAGRIWRKGSAVKGGSDALGGIKKDVAKIKRNDKAV